LLGGGCIILKKNNNSIKYIKEWLDMCTIYEDISNVKSINEESNLFYENRHDQSLLSVILHKYNINVCFFKKKYLQNVRTPY
jgi:hypothetical protein